MKSVSWWERPALWVRQIRQEPGTENLRRFVPLVHEAVRFSDRFRALSEGELQEAATNLTSTSLEKDRDLVRYLALASEAAYRTLGLDPFAEQLLAAASMLRGRVVDMATGEGKTLVGFIVAAGLGVTGRQVHVLSANEYLAARDAAHGSVFFEVFGLSSGAVAESMPRSERAQVYGRDVVYATVHQVGFDLLRDRQRTPGVGRMLPGLDAAVVDEVDAVLLDDAMVPLILAGEADPVPQEAALTAVVGELVEGVDFEVDGERRGVSFTDGGFAKVEQALGVSDLYAPEQFELLTAAHVALHARALVERDVHYIIVDGQIQLINDARGRVADRQRWPDGLHAAVERKEGLVVTRQSEVLDQILVESVARGYLSLTGMSGTAREAAERLSDDLQLRTGMVPTHRQCVRVDEQDRLFSTIMLRDESAAEFVCAARRVGRPVLVGTANVGESERFARLLAERGVQAQVLNAKNDAQEAEVIARAGRFGAVTVSTQMAGRGVDIQLDRQARKAGGLLIVGLGRYESARLDRQLRGRSGRQGDPGSSVFFTSLEDAVVSRHIEINEPPVNVGDGGRITDPKFLYVYEHAQRVAEGKLLQLHRTTRKYNKIVDAHSEIFLNTRERILVEEGAFDEYLDQVWPDGPEHGARWRGEPDRTLAIEVVLHQLDRAWSGHVNLLTATLEGIHLRVLGRLNPLDEFNRIAIQDFLTLGARARDAVRDVLDAAPEDADSLGDIGLRRPSSTWTYMVTDNPFMSQADHIMAFIAKKTRGENLPPLTYK